MGKWGWGGMAYSALASPEPTLTTDLVIYPVPEVFVFCLDSFTISLCQFQREASNEVTKKVEVS